MKTKYFYLLFFILFVGCKISKDASKSKNYLGEYIYENKPVSITITLEDSTYIFKEIGGGMFKRYSTGVYRMEGNKLLLKSLYKGGAEDRLPITWKVFDNKEIAIKNNKIFYGDYILKKCIK